MSDGAANVTPAPARRRHALVRRLRATLCAALGLAVSAVAAFHAAVAFWPYPPGLTPPPRDATFLADAAGHPLAQLTAPDGRWRLTLAEHEISPHLLAAVVAVEDARFWSHGGVDWLAAAAAAWQDATSLRLKRGASTITMQLHRLRHPGPRSLAGKLTQAVRAVQIERSASKRAILVEYLNRAPFGGNLVGAGAASWRYFDRPCRDLSLAQAALLAGLPKNPTADRPDRAPARAKARRDHVLARMRALGLIDAAAHAHAVAEPIDATPRPLPQQADPAARAALPALTALAQGGVATARARTTLDLPTQQLAASAAQQHLDQQGGDVRETAVVVVDTATGNCLASVSLSRSGSTGLDLTRRPRSTGSVIKPLIYAAAFDAGVSSPQALLDDTPAAWGGGYAPANYDAQFRGRLTAANALAESRNLPALRLLADVGVDRAAAACGALGVRKLARSPSRYGLSLAVGGAEATVTEIAEAYATLARGGVPRPVRLTPSRDNSAPAPPPVISPRACREALDCLRDAARTAALSPEAAALRVAWKTGTSSGHRDAWCAAVGPSRVVVVWLGNASGAGAKSLVGAEAAAPLALRIAAALDANSSVTPPPPPLAAQPAAAAAARPAGTGLTIVSPADRSEIVHDPDAPPDRQRVLLRAAVASDTSDAALRLFWFVDGSPVGTSDAGETLWWRPTAGRHEVRVVDAAGRAARATIRVWVPPVGSVAGTGADPRGDVP